MKECRYLLECFYSKKYYEFYFFNDYDEMIGFIDSFDSNVDYITYYLDKDLEVINEEC